MSLSMLSKMLRATLPLCPALLMSAMLPAQHEKTTPRPEPSVISLAADTRPAVAPELRVKGEASFDNAPANFHAFAPAHVGEDAGVETLMLNFSGNVKLGKIESQTKDFVLESGGTCHEGNTYSAGESCALQVRFTPQGAGNRLGKITVENSLSARPFALGIGGNGYAPVISFTPAMITTVPGTYPSNAGLLKSASSLTVDGSDTLYVADTGNNNVRYLDSGGTWTSLTAAYTAPLGIAVDTFGEVYFDLSGSNLMYEIYDYGPVVQITGSGTATCPASTPCVLSSEALGNPGLMVMDPYNHLFFADDHSGAAMSTVQPEPANLIFLYDPFVYQEIPVAPIGVDSGDNIYSPWQNGSECEIVQQSLYNAENTTVAFNKVAGGHNCGFSGDGGQAGNAEISARTGAIAFDLAGDLYFSDTGNQRVRRIDYNTGQINTVAGNGTAGYTGDNNQATIAELATPTGVTVDSQGQVYIISSTAANGTAQVIRKLGPNGFLNFGGQNKGFASTAHLVTVSNTGNATMTLTSYNITGNNPGDFKIDPNTTSCMLTAGATLAQGQSCKIGVIFTPAAGGARSANLNLLNNTVTSMNTIVLAGSGVLPTPTLTINSPTAGSSVAAGTAITFKVTLSGTPTPTGKVTMTLDNATISGSPVTLSSGTASLSVTTSVTGSHTLKAVYSGDTNWNTATASVAYTVTAAASKTFAPRVKPILVPRSLFENVQ